MTAIDFPNSPTVNQEFTSGSRTWIWNGTVWNSLSLNGIRRDTSANWTLNNPILGAGEQGYETDTRESKVGNGTTAWTSLPYSRALAAPDYETTVKSSSTKTLTVDSPREQIFTGSVAGQIVTLPNTSTLTIGDKFYLFNNNGSTSISVITSTSAAVTTLIDSRFSFTCISTSSNSASAWLVMSEGGSFYGNGRVVLATSGTMTSAFITTSSLTLGGGVSANAGRFTYSGSTLKLGNGTSTLTFSDDSVKTNASMIVTTSTDKSANYTLVASDENTYIRSTGSAITITVPDVLADGESVNFIQAGAGQITFAGSGITISSTDAKLKTNKQFSGATITKLGGAYYLVGDLAA
jgi:hypothetical protein